MNDDDKAKVIMGIMPLFIILAMMISSTNVRAGDIEAAIKNVLNSDYRSLVQDERSIPPY